MTSTRLLRLRQHLKSAGIDNFFTCHLKNIYYLTGFKGSNAFLLLIGKKSLLFSDGRYRFQIYQQVKDPSIEIVIYQTTFFEEADRLIKNRKLNNLGFEEENLRWIDFKKLKSLSYKLIPAQKIIDELRTLKSPGELRIIQKAQRIVRRVYNDILKLIRPEIREKDVADEIDYRLKKYGGEAIAFETIVASGIRSALPHGVASLKKIKPRELIVLDFGTVLEGYCSDFTRTVIIGQPHPWQKKIYEIVKQAQARALRFIGPGRTLSSVDRQARDWIEKQGFGSDFNHNLGHGLGLDIHEKPSFSPRSIGILKAGTVCTVEPGIYLKNQGGVRIEDVVSVTSLGCRNLTGVSQEFLIL